MYSLLFKIFFNPIWLQTWNAWVKKRIEKGKERDLSTVIFQEKKKIRRICGDCQESHEKKAGTDSENMK